MTSELLWGGAYGGGIWLWSSGRSVLLTGSDENVDGFAVRGRTLWWVNNGGGDIFEATIQGTRLVSRRVIVHVSGIVRFDGLAVDGGYLYWTAEPTGGGSEVIGRASITGGDVQPMLIDTGGTDAAGVSVAAGYIYWVGGGNIGRAHVDGSDVKPNFVAGLEETNPGAIIVSGGYIYWTATGGIGRVSISGLHPQPTFVRLPGLGAFVSGLAADGRFLYSGGGMAGGPHSVDRAPIDGSQPDAPSIARAQVDGVMSFALMTGG